ncbi:MAG: type II toxin-antitoxin system VapC family toxin [Bacteroidota bacterium]|nr:type II toxin-antitoxin system VapC family toxin [Bacteroidota bacterium]
MNNLIDTHTLIWFLNGDSDLSESAKKAIEEGDAINFISIASLWEMAIRISLGKLELNRPFSEILEQIQINGFQVLPITFEDTLILSNLPFHHRDPFDRIIIAQSLNNKLTIISKDRHFSNYPVSLNW